MKKIQVLAVMVLVVALGGIARAANFVKPASVTVVGVQGEARYSTDGKVWHPLVAGKILHEGAVIETAANSSADLVLSGRPIAVPEQTSAPQSFSMVSQAPDPNIRGYVSDRPMAEQNVIRMDADTMLAVDRLTVIDTGADTVSDTELDLRAGGVFTNVKKMSASSQFIIKLPNGVAGIRGSCGHLGYDGSTEWITGVIVLSLIGPNGQPHVVVVNGGFDYNPKTGELTNLSPSIISVLKAFGDYAETIYASVIPIARDITLVRISPTQGTRSTGGNGGGNQGGNQGGDGGNGGNGGDGGGEE
jgi:hypothetical protein